MGHAFDFLRGCCAAYGYPVLFAGVFLENAGLPVPGETAVLVSGALAGAGGYGFRLWEVVVVTVVAAVLGDNLGYWLGRTLARPRLRQGRRFLFLTPALLCHAEIYFARFGIWTVFLARFITGIRVVGAMAAGTAGMRWGRFLLANMGGAVAWAVVMSLLGYFFGQNLPLLEKWLRRGGWAALAAVVAAGALLYYWRYCRRTEKGWPDPSGGPSAR